MTRAGMSRRTPEFRGTTNLALTWGTVPIFAAKAVNPGDGAPVRFLLPYATEGRVLPVHVHRAHVSVFAFAMQWVSKGNPTISGRSLRMQGAESDPSRRQPALNKGQPKSGADSMIGTGQCGVKFEREGGGGGGGTRGVLVGDKSVVKKIEM